MFFQGGVGGCMRMSASDSIHHVVLWSTVHMSGLVLWLRLMVTRGYTCNDVCDVCVQLHS
jgi:hypothetical protein